MVEFHFKVKGDKLSSSLKMYVEYFITNESTGKRKNFLNKMKNKTINRQIDGLGKEG